MVKGAQRQKHTHAPQFEGKLEFALAARGLHFSLGSLLPEAGGNRDPWLLLVSNQQTNTRDGNLFLIWFLTYVMSFSLFLKSAGRFTFSLKNSPSVASYT